jgi:hypothetical protein
MGVRKCISRARTIPTGYNFDEVLKKGKSYHKNRDFEMQPFVHGNKVFWSAETITTLPFVAPVGTIKVKRLEHSWKIVQ